MSDESDHRLEMELRTENLVNLKHLRTAVKMLFFCPTYKKCNQPMQNLFAFTLYFLNNASMGQFFYAHGDHYYHGVLLVFCSESVGALTQKLTALP